MQVHLLQCREVLSEKISKNVFANDTVTYVYVGRLRNGLKLLKTYEDNINAKLKNIKTEIKLLSFSSTEIGECVDALAIEAFTDLDAHHLDEDFANLTHMED